MSRFNAKQVAQLLKPIHPNRVLKDGKQNSHVSQQDVTAHLIRVFGFGSYDTEILTWEPVFESARIDAKGEATGRWDVCYRASLRLTVRDEHGDAVCHFEDGATHTAQNQTRGDAHDLAAKSSLSLAKKRCAINLGDQFGLSLYNKGQMTALVKGTLVDPSAEIKVPGVPSVHDHDMQDGVDQQVSLGNDEIDPGDEIAFDVQPWEAKIAASSTSDDIVKVGQELNRAPMPEGTRVGLRRLYAERLAELTGVGPAS